jgi:small nuclear ribonucleoprotein (snRNP)-like protein
MTYKCEIAKAALILFLAISPAAQHAVLAQVGDQPRFGTWDAVRSIPSGDKVEIKLKSGSKLRGDLVSGSDTAVIVRRGSESVTTNREDVKSLSRIIEKSSKKPILVGALIGAGAIGGGTAIAAAGSSNSGDDAATFTILMGLAGAGIGALVGSIFSNKKKSVLIYESQ